MRLLASCLAAAALAFASIGPNPAAASTSATVITLGPSVPPVITFAATGNATVGGSPLEISLPITSVVGSQFFHAGSGVDVTLPTSVTSLPVPITVSAFDFVFDFATNLVTATIFNPPGPAVALPILTFAPGVAFDYNLFVSPVLAGLLASIGIPGTEGVRVGSFTQVPVPASLVLLATFGLALAGAASVRRLEPLRAAA